MGSILGFPCLGKLPRFGYKLAALGGLALAGSLSFHNFKNALDLGVCKGHTS